MADPHIQNSTAASASSANTTATSTGNMDASLMQQQRFYWQQQQLMNTSAYGNGSQSMPSVYSQMPAISASQLDMNRLHRPSMSLHSQSHGLASGSDPATTNNTINGPSAIASMSGPVDINAVLEVSTALTAATYPQNISASTVSDLPTQMRSRMSFSQLPQQYPYLQQQQFGNISFPFIQQNDSVSNNSMSRTPSQQSMSQSFFHNVDYGNTNKSGQATVLNGDGSNLEPDLVMHSANLNQKNNDTDGSSMAGDMGNVHRESIQSTFGMKNQAGSIGLSNLGASAPMQGFQHNPSRVALESSSTQPHFQPHSAIQLPSQFQAQPPSQPWLQHQLQESRPKSIDSRPTQNSQSLLDATSGSMGNAFSLNQMNPARPTETGAMQQQNMDQNQFLQRIQPYQQNQMWAQQLQMQQHQFQQALQNQISVSAGMGTQVSTMQQPHIQDEMAQSFQPNFLERTTTYGSELPFLSTLPTSFPNSSFTSPPPMSKKGSISSIQSARDTSYLKQASLNDTVNAAVIKNTAQHGMLTNNERLMLDSKVNSASNHFGQQTAGGSAGKFTNDSASGVPFINGSQTYASQPAVSSGASAPDVMANRGSISGNTGVSLPTQGAYRTDGNSSTNTSLVQMQQQFMMQQQQLRQFQQQQLQQLQQQQSLTPQQIRQIQQQHQMNQHQLLQMQQQTIQSQQSQLMQQQKSLQLSPSQQNPIVSNVVHPIAQQQHFLQKVQDKQWFDQVFNNFMISRNITFNRVPILASKPLNMHALFLAVVEAGGMEKLSAKAAWRPISKKLGYDTQPNVPSLLRKHYTSHLYPFEQFLFPSLTSTNPDANRKSVTPTPLQKTIKSKTMSMHSTPDTTAAATAQNGVSSSVSKAQMHPMTFQGPPFSSDATTSVHSSTAPQTALQLPMNTMESMNKVLLQNDNSIVPKTPNTQVGTTGASQPPMNSAGSRTGFSDSANQWQHAGTMGMVQPSPLHTSRTPCTSITATSEISQAPVAHTSTFQMSGAQSLLASNQNISPHALSDQSGTSLHPNFQYEKDGLSHSALQTFSADSPASGDTHSHLPPHQSLSSQQQLQLQQIMQMKQLQMQKQSTPSQQKEEVLVKTEHATVAAPLSQGSLETQAEMQSKTSHTRPVHLFTPRSRRLTTYGGIDLEKLARAIRRASPCKEQYAIQDMSRLTMSLKSRLQSEVRYALDALLIFSHEGTIRFTECIDLLNALVRLAGDSLTELFSLTQAKMQVLDHPHATYLSLFETQFHEQHMLEPMGRPTLCRTKLLSDCCLSIGIILRNCSFFPENQRMLAEHAGVVELLYWEIDLTALLDTPMAEYIDGNYTADTYDQCSNVEDEASKPHQDNLLDVERRADFSVCSELAQDTTDSATHSFPRCHRQTVPKPTFSMLHILDHRKNAIVILSNIGNFVHCRTESISTAFLNTISDFIGCNSAYVYPALDAMARLMLVSDNLDRFSRYDGIYVLANRIAALLPDRILFDMPPEQHALLELVSMTLYSVTFIGNDMLRQHICQIPGLIQTLLRLCHLPYMQYIGQRVNVTQAQFKLLQKQLIQMLPICQRSMRTIYECAKYAGNRDRLLLFEQELLETSIDAQQAGDDNLAKLTAEVLSELSGVD
ncbi:hypothetical protein BDV3_000639 [Batrachochytrium dendrobatidis]|uniref:ARID domain-containing protein n=1 Tax=Batrachochytrium dendrobatidis (strain JEL423) TaxID=403673 RepID=A0A177W7E3_BATDL|nr:hypothetical protein BDEG_20196 [Batrachochytrium dendrobatidis JEL423]